MKLVEEKRAAASKGDKTHHGQIIYHAASLREMGMLVAENYKEAEYIENIAVRFGIDLEELKQVDIEDFLILEDAYEGEKND